MKDDSSLDSFVKRIWELHGEKVRYLAVGVWNAHKRRESDRRYTRPYEITRPARALR